MTETHVPSWLYMKSTPRYHRKATTEPAARRPAASRRQFFLLFDLSFSSPDGLLRAREAALQFIDEFEPWDSRPRLPLFQLALAIKVLINFTTDRRQLAVAVNNLGLQDLREIQDPLKLAYTLGQERAPIPSTKSMNLKMRIPT